MSNQPYYSGDRYTHSFNDYSKPVTSSNHQPSSRSSDYISRPSYSSSDYISKPSQPRSSSYTSRSSTSDYITRPAESRSDYISPRQLNSNANVSSKSTSKSSYAQYSSSSDYSTSRAPPYTRSFSSPDTSISSPREYEKSNYQLIKEGGWEHKLEFMRSHGLKNYTQEDFDEANQILDRYRDIDAHNAREEKYYGGTGFRAEDAAAVDSDIESRYQRQRRPSDIADKPDANAFDQASDICSYRSDDTCSDRASLPSRSASPSVCSNICATRSEHLGSDFDDVDVEGGYASHDDVIASDDGDGIRSGESECASSDGEGLGEGSDYVSSGDEEERDGGEEDGEDDVVASSDVASVSDGGDGDGGSDGGYGDDDYMDDGVEGYDEICEDEDEDGY